jgi:acyl carrier protein
MDPEALEARIRAFLQEKLEMENSQLARDSELVTTGLIDSMDLVRLATHIERMLGITIPDQDINLDHFDSIAKIVAYVGAKIRS